MRKQYKIDTAGQMELLITGADPEGGAPDARPPSP